MAGSYGNITIRGSTQAHVVSALRGRRAAVTANVGDIVVVFDSVCDDQDTNAARALISRLSRELSCTALSIIVHHDDVLFYDCCHAGELVDSYNSLPNYWKKVRESDAPWGGNAQKLCELFNVSDHDAVHRILHGPEYAFATDRLNDLARELRLPDYVICMALECLDREDYLKEKGLSLDQVIRAADPPPVEDPKLRRDRQFYESLGHPRTAPICKRDGCGRGTVPLSVLCKQHHFEMVRGYPCPFTH